MFHSASAFNQPLNFETSIVTGMYGMFQYASAFNQPLSFDTSSVTATSYMFYVRSSPCPAPNLCSRALSCKLLAPRSPAVSRLLTGVYLASTACPPFDSRQYATVFNQPLSFDTSSVTDMRGMFYVRSSPRALPPDLQSGPPLHAVYLQSSPPCTRCVCAAVARSLPPRKPTARLASYTLSAWQVANSLSAANKLLIRCAWAGNSAFASAGYDSSWGPGNCA